MQITILSVAAKPQQFFKGKKKIKKKIRIIVQSQISELRSQWGKSTYVGPCGFWNPGEKSPPARNQEEKAFWEEKRGGCRNAEHTVWIYDVPSSGSKAPVGPRLPRRGFMTGSCFLCWTFSQRGWWADQLVSFGGVTWFALLPFSMQGTLSASAPAKQTSRGGQGEQQEAHCWALPQLMFHSASRWAGSQAEARAHCSGLACPSCPEDLQGCSWKVEEFL